jgi:hypothetical protein
MVRKPVKKIKKPPTIRQHKESCNTTGCKRITAYSKTNRKTQKMEHWCAPCFDKYVVKPNKEWGRKIVAEYKANAERRERILAKQKNPALSTAVKQASASGKPRRVVKKGVKK